MLRVKDRHRRAEVGAARLPQHPAEVRAHRDDDGIRFTVVLGERAGQGLQAWIRGDHRQDAVAQPLAFALEQPPYPACVHDNGVRVGELIEQQRRFSPVVCRGNRASDLVAPP